MVEASLVVTSLRPSLASVMLASLTVALSEGVASRIDQINRGGIEEHGADGILRLFIGVTRYRRGSACPRSD